ncbi:MAG: tripartite tricarboxylate transporter substrate-binding protein [Pigmentiphaga sp.]|nr:tripartite tricarboxylate transporter substrate-binding protein [Pigmentiphaga sp.]
MKGNRLLISVAATVAALGVMASSHADANYPSNPIKFIVGAPAGGVPDVVARVVGQKMAEALGQSVVVENKTGAGAIIATESAAKARPDGYTLLVADSSPFTINPTLYKRLPYDGIGSFEPIAFLGAAQLFLAAGPSLKADSVQGLIAEAKAQPGKLTYGTIGIGSLHHVMFEEMGRVAGINMLHVPFREQPSGPAAAGQVEMLLAGKPSIEGLVQAGKLRLLGIASDTRMKELPEVPTLAESGVPEYAFTADIGLYAPKGTPSAITAKLAAAAQEALKHPEVRQRLTDLGIIPDGRVLDDYASYMKDEITKFSRIVKAAGLAGLQ